MNLQKGELRKQGQKLKLQEQPFQVLAALLERPREIVTREELRSRLWPDDTFVDFDHGLNAAVKRLRDVLGESAQTPMFIETLSRRGYRFVYPVDGYPSTAGGDPRHPAALPGPQQLIVRIGERTPSQGFAPRPHRHSPPVSPPPGDPQNSHCRLL